MIKKIFVFAVLAMASSAHAESYMCLGQGRFAQVDQNPVNLTWGTKDYQKPLMQNDSIKVQLTLDKSNSQPPYLVSIDVLEIDKKTPSVIFRGAKGGSEATLIYIDGDRSMIVCSPIGH